MCLNKTTSILQFLTVILFSLGRETIHFSNHKEKARQRNPVKA